MLNRKSFLKQIGSVVIIALIAKLLPARALKEDDSITVDWKDNWRDVKIDWEDAPVELDLLSKGQQQEKSPYVFLFSDEEQGQVIAVTRMSDLATYSWPCWLLGKRESDG